MEIKKVFDKLRPGKAVKTRAGETIRLKPGVDLSGKDLRGIAIAQIDMSGSNFDDSDMSGVRIKLADLRRSTFVDTNLKKCVMFDVDLSEATLNGADLSGAKLHVVDFIDANMSGVNLRGAILADSALVGTDLSGADLSGVVISRHTSFAGAKFDDFTMPDDTASPEYEEQLRQLEDRFGMKQKDIAAFST